MCKRLQGFRHYINVDIICIQDGHRFGTCQYRQHWFLAGFHYKGKPQAFTVMAQLTFWRSPDEVLAKAPSQERSAWSWANLKMLLPCFLGRRDWGGGEDEMSAIRIQNSPQNPWKWWVSPTSDNLISQPPSSTLNVKKSESASIIYRYF